MLKVISTPTQGGEKTGLAKTGPAGPAVPALMTDVLKGGSATVLVHTKN